MKKTFFTAVVAAAATAATAQVTPPATPPTTQPTTTSPTATSPMTTTPPASTNNGTTVTNSTSDPMKTVTNTPSNSTWTNTAPATSGWSNYNTWNSPMPGTTMPATNATTGNGSYPSNNGATSPMNGAGTNANGTGTNMGNGRYPLNSAATPPNNTNSMSATGTVNGSQTMGQTQSTGAMQSTSDYNAYGTPNVALPDNVNMSYQKAYPSYGTMNNTWTQYGDWFYSSYMGNGRLTQIFYDNRGNGYTVSLPVLMTYVPENIVDQAIKRYGTALYSVTAVKTGDGTRESYLINLIDRGQSRMEYVGDDGAAVTEVWRMDPPATDSAAGTMTATDANAAMGNEATPSGNTQGSMDAGSDMMNSASGNAGSNTKQNSKPKAQAKKTGVMKSGK